MLDLLSFTEAVGVSVYDLLLCQVSMAEHFIVIELFGLDSQRFSNFVYS